MIKKHGCYVSDDDQKGFVFLDESRMLIVRDGVSALLQAKVPVCLCLFVSICLSVRLPVCLSVCLSISNITV